MPSEQEQRERVAAVARSWLKTPYHHMGRVKGVGVDCATLLCEVFHEAGLIPRVELEFYPPDWHMHRDDERYMNIVKQFAGEVPAPSLGDVVLFRIGRAFAHGGIVVGWPQIIHAQYRLEVMYGDALNDGHLKFRKQLFFSVWAK